MGPMSFLAMLALLAAVLAPAPAVAGDMPHVFIGPSCSDTPGCGHVPALPCGSLLYALTQVVNGGTIYVTPGIYARNYNLLAVDGLDVTITAWAPPGHEDEDIDPMDYQFYLGAGNSWTVRNMGTGNVVLSGLSFGSDGTYSNGPLFQLFSGNKSLTFDHCIFFNYSYAVWVDLGANVTFQDTYFTSNGYQVSGG